MPEAEMLPEIAVRRGFPCRRGQGGRGCCIDEFCIARCFCFIVFCLRCRHRRCCLQACSILERNFFEAGLMFDVAELPLLKS